MSRANRPKRGTGRRTISIVVDGETEVWYFQMMRDHENLGSLSIKPELPQKKKFSDQFDIVCTNAKVYDEVIWVLDLDTVLKESREANNNGVGKIQELKRFMEEATTIENVHICVNTPCLEFWFLLHHIHIGKFYPECEPLTKLLGKTNVLPGYIKTEKYFKNPKSNIYMRLKGHQSAAIAHAKRLGDFDIQNPESAKAEVYKLFDLLGIEG